MRTTLLTILACLAFSAMAQTQNKQQDSSEQGKSAWPLVTADEVRSDAPGVHVFQGNVSATFEDNDISVSAPRVILHEKDKTYTAFASADGDVIVEVQGMKFKARRAKIWVETMEAELTFQLSDK